MAKITLKIERHYGNKDFKTIVENLVSMKLSNIKFNSELYDKSYCNIDMGKTAICQERSKVRIV